MLEESDRIKQLNDSKVKKEKYILYWMQSSQRVEYNHALVYAIKKANKLNQPLLVAFGLTEFPEANRRHYKFMLEGLTQVQKNLLEKGAGVIFKYKDPADLVIELLKDASLTVIDRGYLKINKQWYKKILRKASCPVVQVESNAVIPVETASIKEEYSAATLRRKITPYIDKFLKNADLLVVAVGRANFITADRVKEGVVVIDVGMNRIEGKLCGDVAFDEVLSKVSKITPVPGGVGPMTVHMLMQNTFNAYKNLVGI